LSDVRGQLANLTIILSSH